MPVNFFTRSFSPENNTNVVIFSKNRAMQLDLCLRSYFTFCETPNLYVVHVIYVADNEHEESYQKLIEEYPYVKFIKQTDFKTNLIDVICKKEFVFFIVDDNVFCNGFSIFHATVILNNRENVLGFSYRLSPDINYCYALNIKESMPNQRFDVHNTSKSGMWYTSFNDYTENKDDTLFMAFYWTFGSADFGYPLEVSSSLYRTNDILGILNYWQFNNPNSLEAIMNHNASGFLNKPLLACYKRSPAFCIPANRVQTIALNRVGNNLNYGSEKLLQLFYEGKRIDISDFYWYRPTSCHEEKEFKFV